ncbi:hypothetical protein FRC04_003922 [Tulasnella sp. 424]|nr:hypothetical protein FRC04_003922 [Tulasnella sp. 424]KAG8964677.1 hypothetical protein FRC05_003636 [Tulasnella sp. 425]
MKFAFFGLALLPALASAAVPLYGQCGGSTYTGETECVAGAVCQYSNDFYSQCVAGTAATTTTTSKTSTTTTKTSTSTTKTSTTTSKPSTTTTTTKTTTSSGSSSTVPSGALTVGKSGQGKYSTITQALADTSSNIIYVYPGNYTEQVVISRSGITIYGETSNKLAYSSNTVTVSGNKYAGSAGSNDASGTIRILATGVKIYNLNIENTFGKPIDQAQAIALSVQAGTFACYACQIRGYQDTLLANKGTQFYGKSLIQGSVDFIFGQEASIWITGGTINTVGSGYITASGRSTSDANYYVIDHTTVTGSGSVYLGRPWRNYARVVFQNSNLGSNIVTAGWKNWSDSDPRTDNILFGEYNNSGSGAWKSGRASFATNLSSGISISTVLGSTSWIDSAYL